MKKACELDRPIRIAVFATHPIQYQAPVWRTLARSADLQIHVFYATDMSLRGYRDQEFGINVQWDMRLDEGYPHTFFSRDPRINRVSPWFPGAPGVTREFRSFRPDVAFVSAYGARFWVETLVAARRSQIPVVMRHEASDVAFARSRIKSAMRDLFLRRLYSQVSAFPAIGVRAREHLQRLGVPSSRIGSAPYNVDSEFFAAEAERWLPQRLTLRTQRRINPADVVLVFSGKLVPKKDPELIFSAIGSLPPEVRKRLHCFVLGDGVLGQRVIELGRSTLGDRAHFPGFVNQHDLGSWYAAADCLVLPSRVGSGETWGLVVNEAFYFGLPAIVSTGVGCQPNLVPDHRFGRVFGGGDAGQLAAAISKIAADLPAARTRYMEATQGRIAQFSTAHAASGITGMARRALSS